MWNTLLFACRKGAERRIRYKKRCDEALNHPAVTAARLIVFVT